MTNRDQLFRFIFDKLDIRGELIYLNSSWQAVQERYQYPENVQIQLGQALAAVAILSATIKYTGSLILQIQGNGPLKTLVAQANSEGKLRGLAKWHEEVPTGRLADIYGNGHIVITIRQATGEPYQSIVALVGDNLGSALEHYFMNSEQLQSRFWLFVSADRVAGLFLQELPGKSANREENWARINLLANTSTKAEIMALTPEDFLYRLFHEEQLRLFDPKPWAFECGCSRNKIESSLYAMGRDLLREIIQDEGEIKADCEFCNQDYRFSPEDVEQLFSKQNDSGQESIIH